MKATNSRLEGMNDHAITADNRLNKFFPNKELYLSAAFKQNN